MGRQREGGEPGVAFGAEEPVAFGRKEPLFAEQGNPAVLELGALVVDGVALAGEWAPCSGPGVRAPEGGECAAAEQGEEGEAVAVVGLLAAEPEQAAALGVGHQDGRAGAVPAVGEGMGATGGFHNDGIAGGQAGGEFRDPGFGVGEAAAEALFAGDGVHAEDVEGAVVPVDRDVVRQRQPSQSRESGRRQERGLGTDNRLSGVSRVSRGARTGWVEGGLGAGR